MSAIGGSSLGLITGYAIMDQETGEVKSISELIAGGGAGPAGPQGPVGPQGPKGDPGAAGAKGDKGDKGDTGAAGAAGAKGDTGAAGAAGRGITSISASVNGTEVTLTFQMSDSTTEEVKYNIVTTG